MLLTLSWALPLAGAPFCSLFVGNTRRRNRAHIAARRRRSRWRSSRHWVIWAGFDSDVRRVPVRRARGVDSGVRHRLLHRIDGISLLLVVLTGFLTPDRAALVVEGIEQKVKEFSVFMLRPRGGDDRRLRLARPLPVLRVLGRDAHPDVLPHRDLGLRPAHLRRGQVHALHDGRQRADAGRHPGPGLRCTARPPAATASTC